jgi:hypothetical protein
MVIDIMIQFHAWASARPTSERKTAATRLESQIQDVLKIEAEQGRSSASLSQSFSFLVGRAVFRASYLRVDCLRAKSSIADFVANLTEMTRERLIDFVMSIRNAFAAFTASNVR